MTEFVGSCDLRTSALRLPPGNQDQSRHHDCQPGPPHRADRLVQENGAEQRGEDEGETHERIRCTEAESRQGRDPGQGGREGKRKAEQHEGIGQRPPNEARRSQASGISPWRPMAYFRTSCPATVPTSVAPRITRRCSPQPARTSTDRDDSVDLVLGQDRVERQRDDRVAGRLGHGEQPGPKPKASR